MTAWILTGLRRASGAALAVLFSLGLLAALPVVANEARPLLASPYGELCTTCEGYLLCRPDADADADGPAPVLLHVEKMDFWQQIGTIWTWLKHLFAPVRPDTRHLSVYRESAAGTWESAGPRERVTLYLRTNRIDYPGGWIDRGDGAWHDTADRRIGRCEAVDGLAVLRAGS